MFKVGDTVVCIDIKYSISLTLNKEYKILDIKHSHNYLRIKADDGFERWYFVSRFKVKSQKYSSCKSMEVDSINEEYGPCKKKRNQIQYHLNKLKELTK